MSVSQLRAYCFISPEQVRSLCADLGERCKHLNCGERLTDAAAVLLLREIGPFHLDRHRPMVRCIIAKNWAVTKGSTRSRMSIMGTGQSSISRRVTEDKARERDSPR